ncbi:MAG: sialidase family protein [Pyrinomonadaceae bacterium]
MKRTIAILGLLLALTAPACNRRSTASDQSFSAPVQLSPIDRDAAEPTLAPAPEGGAFLAWVDHQNGKADVMVARLDRGGAAVRPPTRVNPTAGMATAWRGDPPSLAVAPDGTLYVIWTSRTATPDETHATDVLLSVSHDGGQTFSAPLRLNDDGKPADHGMHSLAVGGDGRVYAAWLDGRDPQPDIPMPEMKMAEGEKMPADQKKIHNEGNREVFFTVSADGGKTFSKNVRVASQVCPCCKTSLALAADGRVYVSWRQVLPGSFRHIAVTSSNDGGQTFAPPAIVSDDGWRLAACPVSGAAMDAGTDGHLRVMWYAAGEAGEIGVYQSESTNNGSSFTPRKLFAAGSSRGMPFFEAKSGASLSVWEGGDGAATGIQFGLAKPNDDAAVTPQKIADGATPSATRSEGQIFVAWVATKGEKRGVMLSRTAL